MSKHTWLTKPTAYKANALLSFFQEARKAGFTPSQARCFAGYYMEIQVQRGRGYISGRQTVVEVIEGALRTNHRYASGKNSLNYILCFHRHIPMILAPLFDRAGLTPDTPAGILADRLTDLEYHDDAGLVRDLIAGLPE